eukprot:scaffold6435_cov61-Cylindrotheca_fusiformis.AAC.3
MEMSSASPDLMKLKQRAQCQALRTSRTQKKDRLSFAIECRSRSRDQEDRDGDTPRGCVQDDDDEAIQTVFQEFPRAKTTSISSAKNGDDNYDIKDLDNIIPMKFDEDDLDV